MEISLCNYSVEPCESTDGSIDLTGQGVTEVATKGSKKNKKRNSNRDISVSPCR